MKHIIELQKKMVPDLLDVLSVRYTLLRLIKCREPIGRRSLSNISGLSERVVRCETNFLKNQNLIDIKSSGMYITDEGKEVFEGLKETMRDLGEVNSIARELKEALGIKEAVVVNGNVSENSTIFAEVGRAAANCIRNIIKEDMVISLTGGRTIKAVVDNFPITTTYKDLKVLPGRGGMGKETEIQSNTLVEILANKLGATYELLHIPDNLSKNAFDALLSEDSIESVFESIKSSDILIHGIGLAKEMCVKRNLQDEIKKEIMDKGAIGEAFGHYFNTEGEIVYSMPSVGFNEKDIEEIPYIVAVAVGLEKAEAILALEKNRKNSILVTDEATALEVLRLIKC